VLACTYLCIFERLIPIELSLLEILELFETDKTLPFLRVKDIVEDELGTIYQVRFYSSYFNPSSMTVVLEYIVVYSYGEASIKIIYAENPEKAIREYYKRSRYYSY